MGFGIKTYWLTDRQSQCDFDFDFEFEALETRVQSEIQTAVRDSS
jgi:hypothetical protein